jgi:hypothetical protein
MNLEFQARGNNWFPLSSTALPTMCFAVATISVIVFGLSSSARHKGPHGSVVEGVKLCVWSN